MLIEYRSATGVVEKLLHVTQLGCSRWVGGLSLSFEISDTFQERLIDHLSHLPGILVDKRDLNDYFQEFQTVSSVRLLPTGSH
jgi:hypothetical protein